MSHSLFVPFVRNSEKLMGILVFEPLIIYFPPTPRCIRSAFLIDRSLYAYLELSRHTIKSIWYTSQSANSGHKINYVCKYYLFFFGYSVGSTTVQYSTKTSNSLLFAVVLLVPSALDRHNGTGASEYVNNLFISTGLLCLLESALSNTNYFIFPLAVTFDFLLESLNVFN